LTVEPDARLTGPVRVALTAPATVALRLPVTGNGVLVTTTGAAPLAVAVFGVDASDMASAVTASVDTASLARFLMTDLLPL